MTPTYDPSSTIIPDTCTRLWEDEESLTKKELIRNFYPELALQINEFKHTYKSFEKKLLKKTPKTILRELASLTNALDNISNNFLYHIEESIPAPIHRSCKNLIELPQDCLKIIVQKCEKDDVSSLYLVNKIFKSLTGCDAAKFTDIIKKWVKSKKFTDNYEISSSSRLAIVMNLCQIILSAIYKYNMDPIKPSPKNPNTLDFFIEREEYRLPLEKFKSIII